ncbi:MAG: acyl-CoA dehydrogenase [Myxococcota bacterium]|nr:acyl-CoA dehydrogenase [Myxococcota bacterium]
MADLILDRRDIDFTLFEQFNLGELCKNQRYSDFSEDDFKMILDEATKLAREELSPANAIADRQGTQLVDGKVIVADAFRPVYEKFREGGWIAASNETDFGGMGLPVPMGIMLLEMFSSACCSFMFFPGLSVSAGHLLEKYAGEGLREMLTTKLYTGEWTGTMCLTEPHAGSDVGDIKSTATPIEGTERFSISGNKIFISAGDHDLTPNIVHLVLARVPGDPAGTKGISLFAVPKYRFDNDGNIGEFNDVNVTAIEHKMGIHASPTCALSFGENDSCEGYLIGEQSKGIVYMFQMMNEARIATAVQGSASANASYQLALAYAKERVQGSKVTDRSDGAKSVSILEHPDVRRNLMLCKAYSEGLRALLVQAAFYADRAWHADDEEVRNVNNDLMEIMTPICKAYATDIGFKVTEIAMQIHGGYGYVGEYGVEQYMRDVKIASIYEGTNGIQALDLLGRKMRMKGGGLFLTWLQEANNAIQDNLEHERLGDIFKHVDKAKNVLAETAFGLSQGGKGDIEVTLLGATPFLEMFGQVEVGRVLASQALLADTKLQAIFSDKGANDEQAQQNIIRENEDARFYDGKVKTARFFATSVLPHARAIAAELKNRDRSALDIVF